MHVVSKTSSNIIIVFYIPAGYDVSDSESQVTSHQLKPRSHDLQTLSQEITELETVTMVTRELVHFLGKHAFLLNSWRETHELCMYKSFFQIIW